jgi:four helix bundle protein
MNPEEFKARTKGYGLRVIRLVEALPHGFTPGVLGKQLLRAGTSVGANYRAACRAKSPADFVSKLGNVEEECDESLYWMEQLIDAGYLKAGRAAALMREGEEILSMVVASTKTARANNGPRRPTRQSPEPQGSRSALGAAGEFAIRNPQSAIA